MNSKQKILIVDDEPINIDILSGLLKPHYALLVAKSGKKALKVVQAAKPELILLDIMMPEMDGYEVCRRLKADATTRRIPVIFITAINDVENEAKGLQIGAADYITKPISPSIVMARVNTQLELVRHEQELQLAYSLIKAQKERMAEELTIGRDIQMSMMPVDFPQISDDSTFDLRALLVPVRELGGAMQGVSYRNDTLTLDRGDTLFLFTDGVTEAQNSENALYGEERLAGCLSQHADESVATLNGAVMSDLHHFMNGTEQADDITMLSYRYLEPKDSSCVSITAPITANRIWNRLDSTIAVNDWFDDFAAANHIDKNVQRKLNMVIDDLIMNIISYGFSGVSDPKVEVRLELKAGVFVISFIDNGRPFNPFEEAKPDTSLPITDREVGGLGIHLSRELMDDVSYQRADGSNIVKLLINLSNTINLPDGSNG